MKTKKIFLFVVLCFVACNNSIEKKVETGVTEYLKNNLNDFKSYESISFGKIDSSMTDYYDSPINKRIWDSMNLVRKTFHNANESSKQRTVQYLMATEDLLLKEDSIAKKNFVSEFNGYKVIHKYRAKNQFGALILNTNVFYLDKNFKVENMSAAPTVEDSIAAINQL